MANIDEELPPWEQAKKAKVSVPIVKPMVTAPPADTSGELAPWEQAAKSKPIVSRETLEPTEPTLGEKLKGRGSAMVGHAQKALRSKNIDALGSAAEYIVNTTGEGAGGIGDILGAILKKPAEVVGKVNEVITPGAQAKWDARMAKVMTPVVKKLSDVEAKDPAAGEIVRNLGNIASVVPMGLGIGGGVKTGIATAKATGKAAGYVPGKLAEAVAGAAPVKAGIESRASAIMSKVLRPGKKDYDYGLAEDYPQWALDRQLGGNLQQMKKNANAYHDRLSAQLKDRMKNSTETVDMSDAWLKTMDDFKSVDKTFGKGAEIKSALKSMTKEMEDLIAAKGNDLDVVTATNIKRLAGKNGQWIDDPAESISAKAQVYESLYKHLKKNIEDAAPEVADINKEFHKLIPFENLIAKRLPFAERGHLIELKSMINVGMSAVSGSPIPLALEVANQMGKSGGLAQGAFNLAQASGRNKAAREIKDVASFTEWVKKYEPNLASVTKKIPEHLETVKSGSEKLPNVFNMTKEDPYFDAIASLYKSSPGKGSPGLESPLWQMNKDVRKMVGARPMPGQTAKALGLKKPKINIEPKIIDFLDYLSGLAVAEGREAVPAPQQENK